MKDKVYSPWRRSNRVWRSIKYRIKQILTKILILLRVSVQKITSPPKLFGKWRHRRMQKSSGFSYYHWIFVDRFYFHVLSYCFLHVIEIHWDKLFPPLMTVFQWVKRMTFLPHRAEKQLQVHNPILLQFVYQKHCIINLLSIHNKIYVMKNCIGIYWINKVQRYILYILAYFVSKLTERNPAMFHTAVQLELSYSDHQY